MYDKHRGQLNEKRDELVRRVAALRRDASEPLERDSEEQATQLENAEVASELEAEATGEIGEIDIALSRLEAGSYGTCASCGEPIPIERLNAYPAAVRCMSCASS